MYETTEAKYHPLLLSFFLYTLIFFNNLSVSLYFLSLNLEFFFTFLSLRRKNITVKEMEKNMEIIHHKTLL